MFGFGDSKMIEIWVIVGLSVMALILLPRIKGAVIALLWAHRIAAPKSPDGLDLSP